MCWWKSRRAAHWRTFGRSRTLARREGHIAKVGYNHRFHPAMRKARAIVEAGDLGPLMFIRGRYGHGGRLGYEQEWRLHPEISGGGELIDQGSHLIDLAHWFLGDFTELKSMLRNYYWKASVEDNCFLALLSSAKGQVAWLHATWTEWKNTFSFEISGRDGNLEIAGLGGSYGVETLRSLSHAAADGTARNHPLGMAISRQFMEYGGRGIRRGHCRTASADRRHRRRSSHHDHH